MVQHRIEEKMVKANQTSSAMQGFHQKVETSQQVLNTSVNIVHSNLSCVKKVQKRQWKRPSVKLGLLSEIMQEDRPSICVTEFCWLLSFL
jgi:hypothetical protein